MGSAPVNGQWMRRGQEVPSPSSQLWDPTPTRIAHALPFALLGEYASFSAVCHPLAHCSSREFPSLSRSRLEFACGRMRAWFGRWIEEKPLSPELAAGSLRQMQGSLWLLGELSPSCHWLRQPTGASQRFLRTSAASRWVWETLTSAHQADWDQPMGASLSMRGASLSSGSHLRWNAWTHFYGELLTFRCTGYPREH